MKVLVTGSSGFIGSHLVDYLIQEDHEVFCLIRPESNKPRLHSRPVRLISGVYSDPASLKRALAPVDVVIHLGARIQARDWSAYERANVQCTRWLVDACRRFNPHLSRFVFVSSISAAGPSENGRPKKESDPCVPVSLYGKSKLLAEENVREAMKIMPAVIVRPPNVLGTRQKELMMMVNLLRRRINPRFGISGKRTSLCFVKDLVKALALTAEDPRAIGQTYFVTNPESYTWPEIQEALARAVGVYPGIINIPYSVIHGMTAGLEWISRILNVEPLASRESLHAANRYDWIYDGRKIGRDLGFHPALDLKSGIEQIVAEWRAASAASAERKDLGC